MDRVHASDHYTTVRFSSHIDGYAGLELSRIQRGNSQVVARIVFWDAMGQFWIETMGTAVPLTILEELISEAKSTICDK